VSLLKGKKEAVKAKSIEFPSRLFDCILIFLRVLSIYYSALSKMGII
jgi:hypothetical protein